MKPRTALRHLRALAACSLAHVTALPADLMAQTPPPAAQRLPPAGLAIPHAARAELTAGAAALRTEIETLTQELTAAQNTATLALLPDVEIFHKAVDWALRYDEFFDQKHVAVARQALLTGRTRLSQLRTGQAPWLDATGLIVRGYRSTVDGSCQPYGLLIPPGTSRDRPNRLLVWLLGRGEKRTELAFIAEREGTPPQITPRDTIVLVPYGRFCNATKFAGETDVFESMAAVRTTYQVDADRITVAGFSMGGASTWHLAAHYAGLWCAASPGAGFAETAIYNQALAPRKPPRSASEQLLWHWYNATDYAGNFFNQPIIAYSGELDPQKQSADLMAAAMAREGLKLERLIGPKTAHKYHPETKKELTARLETLADRGRDVVPPEIRVSTYTLRYPGQSWARFEALEKHWQRADLVARRAGPDTVVVTTKNTTAVTISLAGIRTVKIDGQTISLPPTTTPGVSLHRANGPWQVGAPTTALRKRPGLSGPIDDAFTQSFIFVRPTGQPLNPALGAWTQSERAHATKMWRDIFRGDAPEKVDTAITAEDIRTKHLVLWGDPSSNRLLARIQAQLPLAWDARQLVFRGKTYDAAHHAPVLIYPNPLNPERYIVLNSGIDFRDEAYGTNSLQTPKLPDYTLVDLRVPANARWPGLIVDAGFFDEAWK